MCKDADRGSIASGVIRPVLQCVCCNSNDNVRMVRLRVPGKATLYESRTTPLCTTCRKRKLGSWMWPFRGRVRAG